MAAEDAQETTGPSLEPPKLFRRRRKVGPEVVAVPAEEAEATTPTADTRVLDEADLFADSGSADAVDQADPIATPTPAPRAPRPPRKPLIIPAQIGAPLAGLLTGAALLGLMSLGFRGCEALRGTASCGTAPGLLALIVVFALTVLVGAGLLALLKFPDPGMTSFLAVGVTSLIAVLVLGNMLDSTAIVIVLPLLSAAAFAGSWWISTLQVDLDS